MPAKNAGQFIKEAIESLLQCARIDWELIIIDDHSTDQTYSIAKEFSEKCTNISLYKNINNGKVSAINLAYQKSKGIIIKCIAADDVLLPAFFSHIKHMINFDCHYHNLEITDKLLNQYDKYTFNQNIFKYSVEEVFDKIISVPSGCWSFKRNIAEKIFPIPLNLPFEDFWFSYQIRKHSKSNYLIKDKVYLYRQHGDQTYGGIFNLEVSQLIKRADRILNLIREVNLLINKGLIQEKEILYGVNYFKVLLTDKDYKKLLRSKINIVDKIKIFSMWSFPKISVKIAKLKWFLNNIKN